MLHQRYYLFIGMALTCLIVIGLEIYFKENFKLKIGFLDNEENLYIDQENFDPFNLNRKDLETLLARQKYTTNNCSMNRGKLPVCTFDLFHEYMKTCGYFPNKFKWKSGTTFRPSFCDFAQNRNVWIKHIMNNKIENIVTMGDSNAFQFSKAIMTLLTWSGYKCKNLKHEKYGFSVQKDYFFRGNDSLKLSKALTSPTRTCRTCTSFSGQCSLKRRNQIFNITMEYISLTISKKIVIVNETYCKANPSNEVCAYKYQADFIFRYYLRNHMPKILIMFSPIGHNVREHFDDFGKNLKYSMNLIEETLPQSSHVVWVDYSACNIKNFSKTERIPEPGLDRWNKTLLLNTHLFQMVYNKTFSSQGPQVHGFLDLFQLSIDKELDWAADYIHFKRAFYESVIKTLFSMLPSLHKKPL